MLSLEIVSAIIWHCDRTRGIHGDPHCAPQPDIGRPRTFIARLGAISEGLDERRMMSAARTALPKSESARHGLDGTKPRAKPPG